jgi:DNA-binding IclR family transcriptional regulator
MDNSGSLTKAFAILEFVLNSKGATVTPSEMSRALGLNASTCVRLLNVLTRRGYIIHRSRREGYLPGPAVFSFNNADCFYASLVKVSEGIVRDIGLKIGRMVLVSTCRGGRKFLMNYFDGSAQPRPRLNNAYNDFFTTVSGRILLAHLSDKDLDDYIEDNGFPGELWDGIDTHETLIAALSGIRNSDHYYFHDAGKYWCAGVPVIIPGQPCLALSTSVPEADAIPETIGLLKTGAGELKGYFNNAQSSSY